MAEMSEVGRDGESSGAFIGSIFVAREMDSTERSEILPEGLIIHQ